MKEYQENGLILRNQFNCFRKQVKTIEMLVENILGDNNNDESDI